MSLDKLSAPFLPDQVAWRVGSTTADKKRGMALAYIDARDVMRRLDEAVGPENWQSDFPWGDAKRVICRIGIRCIDPRTGGTPEWVWKADGAGDTDYEGEKGALSDAFKRAAVKWGIGRYLYDVEAPWVAIEPAGKSFKIAESDLARLRGLLASKSGPAPQTPPAQAPARPTASAEAPEVKRVRYAKILADLKRIDNLDALDAYMDSVREEIRSFPKEGYDALGALYQKRRDAMATA